MPKNSVPQTAVTLRNVVETDLDHFFAHQLDPIARQMAAFTAKDPTNRVAFMVHWGKVMADPGITIKTVLLAEAIVGHVLCHSWFGNPEVGYWIDRSVWGQGVATAALAAFLQEVTLRPLYARAVNDNTASLRVLEKCGFIRSGMDIAYANARGKAVDEIILTLPT